MQRSGILGRSGGLLALVLAVAGCVATPPATEAPVAATAVVRPAAPAKPAELPPAVYNTALASSLAIQIARQCPREFRHNRALERATVAQLEKTYATTGEQRRALIAATRSDDLKRKLQKEVLTYVDRSGIVLGIPATFCTAGRAEVANKTAIGKYLIAR